MPYLVSLLELVPVWGWALAKGLLQLGFLLLSGLF